MAISIGDETVWNNTFDNLNTVYNGTYELTADITFSSQPDIPILIGTLDGKGYTLTFNYANHKGFVRLGTDNGATGANGTVQNINMVQGPLGTVSAIQGVLCNTFRQTTGSGVIVSTIYSGLCTVTNCTYTGNLDKIYQGSIIGEQSSLGYANLSISNCSMVGNLSGSSCGGISGNSTGSVRGSNIFISNCSLKGNISNDSGGIIGGDGGYQGNVTISDCVVEGDLSLNSGGISGPSHQIRNPMTIRNCIFKGSIGEKCAGIIAKGRSVFITKCSSIVTSIGKSGAGICGERSGTYDGSLTIVECYVKGEIMSGQYASGILGNNSGSTNNTKIIDCYCDITDVSIQYLGGLVGNSSKATVQNCYVTGNWTGWNGAIAGYNSTILGSGYIYITSGSNQIGNGGTVSGGTVANLSDLTETIGTGWDPDRWLATDNYPILQWQEKTISNENDWNTFFNNQEIYNSSYKINNNIIFYSQPNIPIITGTLDGQGYTITFAYSDHNGFIQLGDGSNGATIKNLNIDGTRGTINIFQGGLCNTTINTNKNVTGECIITNCSYMGNVLNSGSGGLIGSFNNNVDGNIFSYSNLKIIYCNISGNICGLEAGGIAGKNAGINGSITICDSYIIGNILGNSAGGICGTYAGEDNGKCTIKNCYLNGDIIGQYSGGICGEFAGDRGSCVISNSYVIGDITGEGSGGICGSSAGGVLGSCTISSCKVDGTNFTGSKSGGICGMLTGSGEGTVQIENCYTDFTNITNNIDAGGIAGNQSKNITINNSYVTNNWSGTNGAIAGSSSLSVTGDGYIYITSGSNQIGNGVNISGGTVANLSDLTGAIGTGWDTNIWIAVPGNYSKLQWELFLSVSATEGTYKSTETLTIKTTFANSVTVTGGTPTLNLSNGALASFASGSGTVDLLFDYTVQSNDNPANPISVTQLNFDGTTLTINGSNFTNGELVNGTLDGVIVNPPEFSSLSASPAVYEPGETLLINVIFDKSVVVNTILGTPYLALSNNATAEYYSGSGSSNLIFSYVVTNIDNSIDPLVVSELILNGGIIENSNVSFTDGKLVSGTLTGVIIDLPPIFNNFSVDQGIYTDGETLSITVAFNNAVNVDTSGGIPSLSLSNGASATYTSGTGSTDLIFDYTVQAADSSANPLVVSKLNFNSSIIEDIYGVNFTDGESVTGLLPNVVIKPPEFSSLSALANTYQPSENVSITVIFTENVVVTTTNGTPFLYLSNGSSATYTSGSGSTNLIFDYTVQTSDTYATPLSVNFLNLNGGTISTGTVFFTNGASVTDELTDVIINIPPDFLSFTSLSGTYIQDNTIDITVRFNNNVDVDTSGGSPTLDLSNSGTVNYIGGSGSTDLLFNYTVNLSDRSADPLEVNMLELNGSQITSNSSSFSDESSVQGPLIDVKIDTSPVVSKVDAPVNIYTVNQIIPITVSFNEAVYISGSPYLNLSNNQKALFTSGSSSQNIVFNYTVGENDNASYPLSVLNLELNGGEIKNNNNDNFTNVNSVIGTFSGLFIDLPAAFLYASATPGIYFPNDKVMINVYFNNYLFLDTTGGNPYLDLSNNTKAYYSSGSGLNYFVFEYDVRSDDLSINPLAINQLVFNGASIFDFFGIEFTNGSSVNQTLPGVIIATKPLFTKFSVVPGKYDAGEDFEVGVGFDQEVKVTGNNYPYLKLSNQERAYYNGIQNRSGFSNELYFSYMVTPYAPTDNLSVLSLILNGASIVNRDGINADISNVNGPLVGVIIGDPHITTFSGVNYDLDKLGPIRLYDNGKTGSERIIINGYSAHGEDAWAPHRQYFRKYYFSHGEKEMIIDSGYRGKHVQILKNTGFVTNEKILNFSKNAASYCQECNEVNDHETMVMIHRLQTAINDEMHHIHPLRRNTVEFMLGDREFFVAVTNVDEDNLQPCRLSIMPLKKTVEGVGCLVDEKYGEMSELESLDDKKVIDYKQKIQNINI